MVGRDFESQHHKKNIRKCAHFFSEQNSKALSLELVI